MITFKKINNKEKSLQYAIQFLQVGRHHYTFSDAIKVAREYEKYLNEGNNKSSDRAIRRRDG